MTDTDDEGEDMVDLMTGLRKELSGMKAKVAKLERYLRDEGYGDLGGDDADDMD